MWQSASFAHSVSFLHERLLYGSLFQLRMDSYVSSHALFLGTEALSREGIRVPLAAHDPVTGRVTGNQTHPAPKGFMGGCPVAADALSCDIFQGTSFLRQTDFKPGAGIMKADNRQVTTVFTVQPSFHHRHSTNRVS